ISGVQAGQAVSKDLNKRLPGGSSTKSAKSESPFVEINVTGKELTDEGFFEFIDVLIECIKTKDDEHPLGRTRVTELHLQGNQLTLAALSKLTEVIALSASDLRELDLSKNRIQIETAEDIAAWVSFLKAFETCFVLKKLDLGSNPLGRLGLEHFARVYLKSDLDFLEHDANALLGSNLVEESSPVEAVARSTVLGKENEPKRSKKKSPHKGKGARLSGHTYVDPADIKKYACTRGLRSIPYLILSDIGLSNTSTLHLLSMLNVQRASEDLLKYVPPGKVQRVPESADLCKSIIWRPNDGLTMDAKRLLEVSERLCDMKSDTESEGPDVDDEDDAAEGYSSKSHHAVNKDAQYKIESNLREVYSRKYKLVRLAAIKEDGVNGSTIWSTALKMMLVSRVILLDGQEHPKEWAADEADEQETSRAPSGIGYREQDDSSSEYPTFSHIENVQPYRVRRVQPTTGVGRMATQMAATTLAEAGRGTGPFHPSAQAFSSDFPTLQEAHVPFVSKRAAIQDEAKNSPLAAGQTSRKSSPASRRKWPRDLPLDLLRRVIAEAVGANGILDHDQQQRIMEYGASWHELAQELKFQGAEEHQQIWKLLKTLECFDYTPWKEHRPL
ncbi:uncharacterized protein BO80DRAFT_349010, partial [Aspergillus ibericus CBS 121593]